MKKIFIALLISMLVGCGSSPQGVASIAVSDGAGSGELKVITLSDGTKCAVLIGYSKAAIDCNWGDK